VDSYGKAAGKGALIQENLAATLGVTQDQYLFQPMGADCYNGDSMKVYEWHNQDSRISGPIDAAYTLSTNAGGREGHLVIEPIVYTRGYGGNTTQDGVSPTLEARAGTGGNNQPIICIQDKNYIDVELEVAVRKYEVDTEKLSECLRTHKGDFSNQEIADILDKPLTLVEHWFRKDKYFAIPEPDVWLDLKKLLNIETNEFDESIMTFEFKGGNYDMRNRIYTSDTAPTLTCDGGNKLYLVPQPFCKSRRAKNSEDATTWKEGVVANTLNTFDQGEVRANELIVETHPTYCLQGNGIDRADTAGCNGKGWKEYTSYTLNTIDRPAVCYAIDQGGGKSSANVTEELSPTLTCTHGGEPAVTQPIYNASKNSFFMRASEDGCADTLMASDYKDPQLVAYGLGIQSSSGVGSISEDVSPCLINGDNPGWQNGVMTTKPHYIVRRLTPTECARLQGFSDRWGHINTYTDFTDEEYQFWLDVRNTHAAINGKKVQDYTKAQMLTWYNKLQTDSSEYKMWGNGIALPTALYVLEGIAEALDDWMD
jgi:site-specific DNA-cytosine methylase